MHLLKRLDQYLLVHYPILWEMRPSLLIKTIATYWILAIAAGAFIMRVDYSDLIGLNLGYEEGVFFGFVGFFIAAYWTLAHLKYSTEAGYGILAPAQARIRFSMYMLVGMLVFIPPFVPRFMVQMKLTSIVSSEYPKDLAKLQQGMWYFPGIANSKSESFNIFQLRDNFKDYVTPTNMWGMPTPTFDSKELVEARIAVMKDQPDLQAIEDVLEVARKLELVDANVTTAQMVVDAFKEESTTYGEIWGWQHSLNAMALYENLDFIQIELFRNIVFFGGLSFAFGFALFIQLLKQTPPALRPQILLLLPAAFFVHGIVMLPLSFFLLSKLGMQLVAMASLILYGVAVFFGTKRLSKKEHFEAIIYQMYLAFAGGGILFLVMQMFDIAFGMEISGIYMLLCIPANIVFYIWVGAPIASRNFLSLRAWPKK